MKRLAVILCLLSIVLFSDAQEKKFKYQGEASLSYTFGLEEDSSNINLEIINGIRFSRYLFAGAGIGISRCLDDEPLTVPLYLNVKGYFPVAKKVDLLSRLDLGTKIDYMYETSGGLMLRPEFGISTPLCDKLSMNIVLRYELYSFRENDTLYNSKLRANQIGLRIGFVF